MLSLKNIMRANAISCVAFGSLFAIKAKSVAVFLGGSEHAPQWLILGLGVLLIINGCHLIWASKIETPKYWLRVYFSMGDFIWVIASVVLIISQLWITTSLGITAAIGVAAMVGLFGVLQITDKQN